MQLSKYRKLWQKKPRKDIRELQKIRENLKIKIRNKTDACEKRIHKDKLKLLKEYITDKIKESRGNQIKRIAESISSNVDNGREIWEVKWKVKRKDETPHFIINSEKRKKENWRNIEIISKVLWKFTTNKTNRKPTGRKNRTRCKHKISKNCRWWT